MPSKRFDVPLPKAVPERDSRIVRCYAEHLEALCLSAETTRRMIGAAKHVAVWLAREGSGLDRLDIRLLDRFMRHECHCLGRHRTGRRPGRQHRQHALRFLRHLLETGHAKAPPEIEAGGRLVAQFLDSLEERGYARSTVRDIGNLYRHFVVWLHLSDIPLAAADERVLRRFPAHDCACVHPGFLDNRPVGFVGSKEAGSTLRRFAAFLVLRDVIPAPEVPQLHAEHGEHPGAFLNWLRQHRGLRDTTIERYERHMRTLLPALGDDPGTYDAARVRNTVLGRLETASLIQVGDEASAFRKVTPHVLRHTCALTILEATGDIRKVSLWLGHQSLQTTEMYLRTDPAEKLGTILEWRSPGLGKGRFKGVKDELMAMLANV